MNILEKWLLDNQRSVSYLANMTGISRQALDNLKRGDSQPSRSTMLKLWVATGIPLGDLARWEVQKEQLE